MTKFQEAFAVLDQYIARQMAMNNIPGLSLALTDRENLLYTAGYGFADMSAQTPIMSETMFEIGSIGKSFTSIALLQQAEAGRLSLTMPVATYLPWFQVQSAYDPITPHHLMSHTAGIPNGTDLAPHGHYEVWALRNLETGSPPGAHFHYSNVGYKALGYLLEEVLGQPYEQIVQSAILDPLGMTATHAVITHETRTRMAMGYRNFYDDRPRPAARPLTPATWHEYGGGDGSPASTPADMTIYLRMLMNRGQGPQGRILTEARFAQLIQPVIKMSWRDFYYGYGVIHGDIDGYFHLGHTGGTLGFSSSLLADMENGLGAVVMVNTQTGVQDMAEFALCLLRAALQDDDLPPLPPPTDTTKIANAADYVATYRMGEKTIDLVEVDGQLTLQHGDEAIILERRDTDAFYANQADFLLFLLRFERDDAGQVVALCHGPDWYPNDAYRGPTTFIRPQPWEAYAGHYRSHNPWLSNFRIVLRKGDLVFIFPDGGERILSPLTETTFRLGAETYEPERIQFHIIVNGQALRATFSGCDYYRTFSA